MPNQAPSGQNGIRTTSEDDPIHFFVTDFGFTDADGNGFAGVVITSVPSGGRLLLGSGSQVVVAGQFITLAQLTTGPGLFYQPNLNGNGAPYDSFTFQVRDNGGTADGGVDTDQSPNTLTINITPSPDGPVISNFKGTAPGFRLSYTENSAPIFLDLGQNATVTDVDSANFNGGCLFVGFPGDSPPFLGYEDFSIADGNGISVTSQAVGGLVQFNGVTFGTITVDQDGFLRVDFNAEATPARVQQLVRQLTYELTDAETLTNTTRNFVIGIKDGSGGETQITDIPIDLVGVNDPPTFTGLDPVVTFTPAAATATPQIIDASVSFSDAENNFGAGGLQLSGALAEDVLAIRNQGNGAGQIGVTSNQVRYGGVLIGTVSGGTSATGPLTVNFNGSASAAAVDALIENLTYFNTSGSPTASRTLSLFVINSLGQQFNQQVEVKVLNGSGGTSGDDALVGTAGNDFLQGFAGNDLLQSLGGNDELDGGTGVDRMEGGAGNDVYYVDNPGDVVIELAGDGSDKVLASVSYTLPAGSHVELLYALNRGGTDPLNLTSNEFDNYVDGNDGANYLRGGDGNDVIFGWGGNDILNGDAGVDMLIGGVGDDIYYVDNAGDTVLENGGEGTDRVAAAASYVLTSGSSIETLEAATLSGTAALDLTGNAAGQTIAGNNGSNILRGEGGVDTLYGYGGNDYLLGGGDSDFLIGGAGDDTYYIDSDGGDVVTELAGEGKDRIATLVSYTLAADASIEIIEATNSTSTNAIDVTGNAFNNLIAGNNGVNILSGGDGNDELAGYEGADTLNGGNGDDIMIGGFGNDTMSGGAGSDKYYVQDAGDTIVEAVAVGDDRVASSVSYTLAAGADIEFLEPITFSGTEALNFTGNDFGTWHYGNNGANILDGKGGADTLEGLGGADTYAFTSAPGGANIDTIMGFLTGTDKIALDDAIFAGVGAPGSFNANAFVVGSAAAEADDRIVYNSATGALLYDSDGNGAGAAVQFATLSGNPAIVASDFTVI